MTLFTNAFCFSLLEIPETQSDIDTKYINTIQLPYCFYYLSFIFSATIQTDITANTNDLTLSIHNKLVRQISQVNFCLK